MPLGLQKRYTAKAFNRKIGILENYYDKSEGLRAIAGHEIRNEFDWGNFKGMIFSLTEEYEYLQETLD